MSSSPSHAGAVEATAAAVGVALVRRALGGLTPAEVQVADEAIRRGIRALPDTTRPGVAAAAALCRGLLLVAGRGDVVTAAPEHQDSVVGVLTRRPLPVVAEFVTLTRGLGLVAVVDHRHRAVPTG